MNRRPLFARGMAKESRLRPVARRGKTAATKRYDLGLTQVPEDNMSRKPKGVQKGSRPATVNDQSHMPAKHIEETARLASSVETDKNLEKVRKAGGRRTHPPPEEDLGGGDICSLEERPSTDDDKPLD